MFYFGAREPKYRRAVSAQLWRPSLDLLASPLLQATLDDRAFRLWEYESGRIDGDVASEINHLVELILKRNRAEDLIAAALQDAPLMGGYSMRGPRPFDPELDGARVAAWRQLELALYHEDRRLLAESVHDPTPSDRAYAAEPNLFERLDKRGLLPVSSENIDSHAFGNDRMVLFGQHAFFPHPHLRPNRELVGDLLGLASEHQVRVALDPNRVVPRDERPDVGLYDYWFGIEVDATSLDDPRAVGRTRHERRVDVHELSTFPLLAIDVHWWLQDDDCKAVEVEETVPSDTHEALEGIVINRYLHAIRDTRRQQWIHIDGAIKAYDQSTYEPTRDLTNAPKGAPIAYRKLWRVDGEIADHDWGRMLGHHFRENELVVEAFGDLLDERPGVLPEQTAEVAERLGIRGKRRS